LGEDRAWVEQPACGQRAPDTMTHCSSEVYLEVIVDFAATANFARVLTANPDQNDGGAACLRARVATADSMAQ
jgi:hypothetical protein